MKKMRHLIFLVLSMYCFLPMYGQNPLRFSEEVSLFLKEDPALHLGATVFAGSSSFRLWEGMEVAFPEIKVLNRGFGGSHFSDLIFFCEDLVLKYQPSHLLIYEGDNDLAAGKSPKEVIRDARTLVKRIRKRFPDLPIAFVCPKPSPARWVLKSQYEAFNRSLKEFTDRKSNLDFLDVWHPALKNGEPDPSLFIEDGLHLNTQGYEIWIEIIGRWFDQLN